jgi:hypothetical protein
MPLLSRMQCRERGKLAVNSEQEFVFHRNIFHVPEDDDARNFPSRDGKIQKVVAEPEIDPLPIGAENSPTAVLGAGNERADE